MRSEEANICLAANIISEADCLLITAGAGMGVDSGLPDFRGNQGFWNQHPIYAEQGLTFYDLATPTWFFDEPYKAWGFYGYRYNLYKNTQPHPGFTWLRQWQQSCPIPGFVYTSNVDGQFQKAGFSPDNLYECHGSIHYLQCTMGCNGKIWPLKHLELTIDSQTMLATGRLPTCQHCGGIARPNILMFDDWNWLDQRAHQQLQRYLDWKQTVSAKRLVTIEIGAGSKVGGVRYSGEKLPGTLIRINPREPQGTDGTISLAMSALDALATLNSYLSVL